VAAQQTVVEACGGIAQCEIGTAAQKENGIDMSKNARHLRWVLFVALTCASLVHPGGLAWADPVIISSSTESSASQEHAAPWLPEAEITAPDMGSAPATGPDNRPDQSRSPRPSESTVPANGPETQPGAQDPGFREAVKEVIRPLHRDLAESGVADAYRELRTELDLKKEQIFGHSEVVQGSENPGQGGSEAATWVGQGNNYGNGEPPRTAAQAERDKILASVMMAKFIDDAKPWVFGLVAVYALGYLIKFVIAYGKYQATRRHRRGRRHRRN
jgi:hypothetical protein